MTNIQKILMATGWAGTCYFYAAWKGAYLEIQANKKNIERANQIITDHEFSRIVRDYDR